MKIFNFAILFFFALVGFSLSFVSLVQADASNAVALYRYFKRFEEDDQILRDHWSSTSLQTTSPTAQGYTREGPQGNLAKTNPGNLRPLYDCTRQISEDSLTITEHLPATSASGGSNCTLLGYMSPNQASGTHPLYKCLGGEGNTSISLESNCEGGDDVSNQGILGYAWNTAGSVPDGGRASPTPSGGGGGSCGGDTDNSTCNVSSNKPDGCSCTNNNQCRSGVKCEGWPGQGKICYGVGGLCSQVRGRPDYCDCEKANQCASNACTRGTCGLPVCKTPRPTPTPTATPTASPTTAPTASPTPPPADKVIEKVEIAEDSSITNNKVTITADQFNKVGSNAIFSQYTFSDPAPGIKSLWVKYTATDETTSTEGPVSIELVAGDPQISQASCSRAEDGSVQTVLTGTNLGQTVGKVEFDSTALTVSQGDWQQDSVKATLSNPPDDQDKLDFKFTRFDGKTIFPVTCNLNQHLITLGADYYCPVFKNHEESDVALTIYDSITGERLAQETVTISPEGIVEGITYQFTEGKYYTFSIKAIKGLTKVVTLKATNLPGNTDILGIKLPIGDIYPSSRGDNQINQLDFSTLKQQWGAGGATKSADFNNDQRVNSFDWSCILTSAAQLEGDALPSFPAVTPEPTPSPTPTPSASPTTQPQSPSPTPG